MTDIILKKFPHARELYQWRRARKRPSIRAITARPLASIGDENAGLCSRLNENEGHAMLRRQFHTTDSLKDRLASFATDAREKASLLPPGPEKEQMLRKARQADTASHLDEWINSSGLQPPK